MLQLLNKLVAVVTMLTNKFSKEDANGLTAELHKLVAVVTMLTNKFSKEHVNGLTAELLYRLVNGIDLVLYSSKYEYPYVEEDGSELQFKFTLADLQGLEKQVKKLASEYNFKISYVGVMMPKYKIQIEANCPNDVTDLLNAGWEVYNEDGDIDMYWKIK